MSIISLIFDIIPLCKSCCRKVPMKCKYACLISWWVGMHITLVCERWHWDVCVALVIGGSVSCASVSVGAPHLPRSHVCPCAASDHRVARARARELHPCPNSVNTKLVIMLSVVMYIYTLHCQTFCMYRQVVYKSLICNNEQCLCSMTLVIVLIWCNDVGVVCDLRQHRVTSFKWQLTPVNCDRQYNNFGIV